MEEKTIKLWGDTPPLYIGGEIPSITYYPAKEKRGAGTVIICPGGGYGIRAPHEGEGYALHFNENGLDAFVLNYRVVPNKFPAALLDARRAIRYVRANAEKYGIDPNKIAIMGSSAGGHLAALTSNYTERIDGEGYDGLDEVDPMPNAQFLCYPVTDFASHHGSYNNILGEGHSEEARLAITPNLLIGKHTPPAFIWHTFADEGVAVASTYDYVTRLKKFEIPTELHIYPFGKHGLGLAKDPDWGVLEHVQSWGELLIRWLKLYEYIKE